MAGRQRRAGTHEGDGRAAERDGAVHPEELRVGDAGPGLCFPPPISPANINTGASSRPACNDQSVSSLASHHSFDPAIQFSASAC